MVNFPLAPQEQVYASADEALHVFLGYVQTKHMSLYPAQEEAILELFSGHNVILNTPTGSGKSLVAEALHYSALNERTRSFYVSPIKALVNEKFLALCKTFSPDAVGLITGDASVNPQASMICCTAEILSNLALRLGSQLDCAHVVLDEFHYYNDRDRGVAWQIPLLTLPQTRFLLMSATFGSLDFFAHKLTELNGKKTAIVQSSHRPVPLHFQYSEDALDMTIASLCEQGKTPVYVVHFTQREAAETAQSLTSVNMTTKPEKQAIAEMLVGFKFTSPFGKEFNRLLRHGIGLHHGGLLPKYRVLVEKLSQKGLLKLICGTDTLGVGVNVPIRTVLFTQLCKYDGQKTAVLGAREFHQISGRAGRKGFDADGFVVIQAPAHVIENKKNEKKAQVKGRKAVKAAPPERGYAAWNQETMQRLMIAPHEALQSKFQVSHSMLLNVLSRSPQDGCSAFKHLIASSHESEVMKERHKKRAMQLLRSLYDRKIIQIIPPTERVNASKVKVNVSLQEDFSLHHTLSLYLLDTLNVIDPMMEHYGLNIVSLVESIMEDPDVILFKQLDRIKRQKMFELKMQGVDFSDRLQEVEELEYPKPLRDFIYSTFNEFSQKHPWVGQENIRPKSIVRDMYETYQSFSEYIKSYDLQRSEGVLLRYLANVYKALMQTVPEAMRNDELDEIIVYLEAMIHSTDSSLLDEWEKMKNPDSWRVASLQAEGDTWADTWTDSTALDITKTPHKFSIHMRNAAFHMLKSLSLARYEDVLTHMMDGPVLWTEELLKERMELYRTQFHHVRTDMQARSLQSFVIKDPVDGFVRLELRLLDQNEESDWVLDFKVDVAASKYKGSVQMSLMHIGPVQEGVPEGLD